MSQNKTERTVKIPNILNEIKLEELIDTLITKNSMKTTSRISAEAFQFAKAIIEKHCLLELRTDNFCIDLTKSTLASSNEKWTKEQYKAFAKLFALFSDKATELLKQKQEQNLDVTRDVQLLWIRLPEQTDLNRKVVNGINKILLNNCYITRTGNEPWNTLFRHINSEKPNPMTRLSATNKSISLVFVAYNEKSKQDEVVLFKRGGLGGRANLWGTLTGNIEHGETKEEALKREVFEETQLLLDIEKCFYVNSFHTPNLSKDLAEKGKVVSYADDCSYVFVTRMSPEQIKSIKLDEENSEWKSFSKEELLQFNAHNPAIHGAKADPSAKHVTAAKAEEALNYMAHIDEESKTQGKIQYPYTKSGGFFAKLSSNIPKQEATPENNTNKQHII